MRQSSYVYTPAEVHGQMSPKAGGGIVITFDTSDLTRV